MDGLIAAMIQLPFLSAFIYFALQQAKQYREDADQRDNRWREFLDAERLQRRHAMDVGFAEVRAMTESQGKTADAVADLARAITAHDTAATERYHHTIQTLRDLQGDGK